MQRQTLPAGLLTWWGWEGLGELQSSHVCSHVSLSRWWLPAGNVNHYHYFHLHDRHPLLSPSSLSSPSSPPPPPPPPSSPSPSSSSLSSLLSSSLFSPSPPNYQTHLSFTDHCMKRVLNQLIKNCALVIFRNNGLHQFTFTLPRNQNKAVPNSVALWQQTDFQWHVQYQPKPAYYNSTQCDTLKIQWST